MNNQKGVINKIFNIVTMVQRTNETTPFKRFLYLLLNYMILAFFGLMLYLTIQTLNGGANDATGGIGLIIIYILLVIIDLIVAIEAISSIIYVIAILVQSFIHLKESIIWSIITIILSLGYFILIYLMIRVFLKK